MSKTLVWMTNSFRADSRLTNNLSGDCAFVYYSPYHFAGDREKQIYKSCSQANLDAFYSSINSFSNMLHRAGTKLHVFRDNNVVQHINNLIDVHGFNQVVIDQPMFAMWHTVDVSLIKVPVNFIDSTLIDDTCIKLTAKSRWTSHIKNLSSFKPHKFSDQIIGYNIEPYLGHDYPVSEAPKLINVLEVIKHALEIAPTYGETRNQHDGQTRLSTALHNGVIDPSNIFFMLAKQFVKSGHDISALDGPASSILRQLAFREISILQTRRANMTLENTPLEWARSLMHVDALNNLLNAKPNPSSTITFEKMAQAKTGDKDIDFLLTKIINTGIMPNRARMYFASKMFYESASGLQALENSIDTFDLLGLDGQSPNNYTQCIGAYGLSYGKVLKMNRDRAFSMLGYE